MILPVPTYLILPAYRRYTVSKKTAPPTHDGNFVNNRFAIFSPLKRLFNL